jgi:hypothetical protein
MNHSPFLKHNKFEQAITNRGDPFPLSTAKVEGINQTTKGYREILAVHMGPKFEKG